MSDTSVSESKERSDGDRGGVGMIEVGVRVRLIVVVAVVGSGLRDAGARRYAAEFQSSPILNGLQTYASLRMRRHVMVPVDAE
jgi:hypothetical protein